MASHPALVQTVLDAVDVRVLAEFYRELLGWDYRPGDGPPDDDTPDTADWLVLRRPDGGHQLAFQQVDRLEPATWPDPAGPAQLHLDMTVPGTAELEEQRARAEALGADLALDRSADPQEPLYVFRDPAGHPFCIFVA